MAAHFLTKTSVVLEACLRLDDQIALESYPALQAFLADRGQAQAGRLFAEPLLSRGNQNAVPSVSWYTDFEGTGGPISRLDDRARADVDAVLAQRLAGLRPLLDDPDGGRLLGAALHVPKLDDIWIVDGQPVMLNWGMISSPAESSDAARQAQYQRTLARYLPLASAPALTAEGQAAQSLARAPAPQDEAPASGSGAALAATAAGAGGLAAGAVAGGRSAQPGSGASGSGGGDAPPPPPPAGDGAEPGASVRRRPAGLIPLIVLLLLAIGTLIWLLIPGSRLFPEIDDRHAQLDEEAARVAAEVNAELILRRDALRAALDGASCRADGTLLLPDGLTVEGLLPPDPASADDAPGAPADGNPTPALPPDVERVVPDGATPEDASLLDAIDRRTALVVAAFPGGSTGSGFFISPELLVTNQHVVEGAPEGSLYVTNEALGEARASVLVAAQGPFMQTGSDYALLRVPGAAAPFYEIYRPQETLRLQSVVAAGYPGDVLETDGAYRALISGDATATPLLTVTSGIVNAEQEMAGIANVVVHSAPISQGNSGGPLVDMCGRVVGVNTFVRQGDLRNLNVALATADLLDFLGQTGTRADVVTNPCAPEVLRPIAPPAAVIAPGAD